MATYNSEKVENFKKVFAEYQVEKNAYDANYTKFREILSFLNDNESEGSGVIFTTDYGAFQYKDGLLMRTSPITQRNGTELPDSSLNSVVNINGTNYYYTDVIYQPGTSETTSDDTNKLHQVGLADLEYNDGEMKSEYRIITNQTSISSHSGECDMSHLSKCSAKAKMTNSKYYGISSVLRSSSGDTSCNCYTFTENEVTKNDEITEVIQTDVIDSSGAYLAIMFDGGLYRLKNDVYYENYQNFYEIKTDSGGGPLYELIAPQSDNNNNPFVGGGINSIAITDIGGVSNCTSKS